jgi:hypothetical protein
MSIKTRKQDIKEQIELVTGFVQSRGESKAVSMQSLTDHTVNYNSRFTVAGKGLFEDITFDIVECECSKVVPLGYEKCKGSERTICRHIAAGFIWSNRQKGRDAELFDKFSDAFRYSNFGGQLVKLVSNGSTGWAVIKGKIEIPSPNRLQRNIGLLRGERETGIE